MYSAGSLILLVIVLLARSANTYRMKMQAGENAVIWKQNHGDGWCNFDSNAAIWQVLIFSFFPTIVLRAIAAIVYRNRDPLDFKNTAFYLKVVNNGSYGIWTLLHLITYS